MNEDNKELAVAALRNGTVIDHINPRTLFQVVKILGLSEIPNGVTIGNNLESKKMGKKGIIKVDDMVLSSDVIDRIALVSPSAVVNIIEDYKVVAKRDVRLPEQVVGIVRCNNPKCITNNEPMHTRFAVSKDNDEMNVMLKCAYCSKTVSAEKAQII